MDSTVRPSTFSSDAAGAPGGAGRGCGAWATIGVPPSSISGSSTAASVRRYQRLWPRSARPSFGDLDLVGSGVIRHSPSTGADFVPAGWMLGETWSDISARDLR